MKSQNRWICFWLGVIAFLILSGVILFAAYIYKFDPLSPFFELFQADANVFWSAINAIATTGIGIATVFVSIKLAKMQKSQVRIEEQQHLLQTEPHILIDSLDVCAAECELTVDKKMIKTIKGINYPYYINILDSNSLTNFSVITITFVNTSEAFARLRFDKATIGYDDNDAMANYNISTFGAHKNHVMLRKGDSGKLGLLIGNDLITKLRGTKLTLSVFLDNNFNECYWNEQSYRILDVCEGAVTFMPHDMSKNVFKKTR